MKMADLDALDAEQRKAVLEGDGACLVVAGPGSGKTRTVVHRLCHQLRKGVRPESILLLTFTNKAAAEMKRRALELGGPDAGRITAGTFHSFANLLLRRHATAAGLPARFTILDEDDSITVLARLVKKRFPDAKRAFASSLSHAISLSRLRMVPLEEVVMGEPDLFQISRHMDDVADIARMYADEKRSMDAVDFDDLLVFAHRLLESDPYVLRHYRSRYTDILVDEFQDTDRLQASFISLLYPPVRQEESGGRNLMVVGDDSQSIYSFRGADIRNMLEFQERFGARLFFLSTNYRSSDPIVKLVNRCMDGSKARIEKTLVATGKGGDLPRLIAAENPTEEAFVIARLVEQELLSGSKVGVLFRSAYTASELELELNRKNIPYELRGGLKFAEQAHIKDMLSLLRAYENPKDKAAASRLMMLMPGIGEKKAEGIVEGSSGWDDMVSRLEKTGSKSQDVSKLLRSIKGAGESPAAVLDAFYSSFYRSYMESSFDDYAERMPDIDALIGAAARSESISAFLDAFALSPDEPLAHHALDDGGPSASSTANSAGKRKPDLILSTIHQAKGLEWDVVFVMGLAEGMLPHARASDVEEERRLFYVAVSRAKSRLFLSYPLATGRFYDVRELQISRFLSGLPDSCYAPEG